MRNSRWWLVTAVVAALVIPCTTAITPEASAAGGGPGNGQNPPNDAFELYGDLYVIVRDVNGEAILDANGCVRPVWPIGLDPDSPQELPGGMKCALVPLCGDDPTGEACLDETESDDGEVEPCDIWDPYPYMADPEDPTVNPLFDYLKEVHFGRLSVSRSPFDVIDHGYVEVVNRLNSVQDYVDEFGVAGPNITTDPAGRIHYYALDAESGENAWFTIDAPVENLSVYDRLMKYGTLLRVEYVRIDMDRMYLVEEATPEWDNYDLAPDIVHIHPCWDATAGDFNPDCDPSEVCDPYAEGSSPELCNDELDPTRADIMTAASLIAAAGDKTGYFTTDMVIHVNTYLGINDLDSEPRVYFPYTLLFDIPYDPYVNFGGKPPVPLLRTYSEFTTCPPASDILPDYPCLYIGEVTAFDHAPFRGIPHCFSWETDFFYPEPEDEGPSIEELFGGSLESKGYEADELGAAQQVAQAAEDARAIIWYIHNWAVPDLESP